MYKNVIKNKLFYNVIFHPEFYLQFFYKIKENLSTFFMNRIYAKSIT